ncbi:MAG TPA: hypothetical protein VJJ76_00185 [archaeon]|nr:hypothetical protein [archaeon]
MKSSVTVAFLAALVFMSVIFSSAIFAQTTLLPGSTSFSTEPLTIGELSLFGNLDYMRVYWNASYLSGTVQTVGVRCYINCNPLETSCDGWQNCTYEGSPGPGVCSVQPVSYNYPLDSGNLAVCVFYNPANPTVEYKKTDGTYPNRTFKPLDFSLFISPNFTVTVGKEFSMQINVKNNGVFTDYYNLTVNPQPVNLVAIDPQTQVTSFGPLTGNSYGNFPETFASIAKMRVLSTVSAINIQVIANSSTNGTVFREQVVQIRAGVSSLPDFGFFGLMQIIIVAAVVLFLKLK